MKPEIYLLAPRSRAPAGVFFWGLVLLFVRIATGGLSDDADQYGYGDEHDDYENKQRDYGD
jgi:hypothetical protein